MGVRGGRGGAEGETRRKRRNTEDDTRLIPVRKFWKYQADTSPEKKKGWKMQGGHQAENQDDTRLIPVRKSKEILSHQADTSPEQKKKVGNSRSLLQAMCASAKKRKFQPKSGCFSLLRRFPAWLAWGPGGNSTFPAWCAVPVWTLFWHE